MKLLSPIFMVFFLFANAYSQDRCSTEKYMQEILGEDHDLVKSQKKSIKDWKESKANTVRSVVQVNIPVHVIIQHDPAFAIGTGDNLSLERIQSQIDVMNEDFSGTNSGFSSVPNEFATGQSEITFCMASLDPDGNPTDGVTRFASTLPWEDNNFTIMAQTIWDRDQYLNIYVTPSIEGLGISPVPSTDYNIPEDWDAPAVLSSAFGGPGYADINQYDLGRTAVHEIGHWLGLSHVWGPNSGGCGEDDGMDDTPRQEQPTYFCPDYPQSDNCSNSIMFMNFMDYVDDACMHAFSQDQVDYMQFIIENVRSGLLTSAATNCAGVGSTPLSASVIETIPNSCWNEDNGSITVSASGGISPYTYSLDGINFQSDGQFTNLENGNYTIVIMDGNNETASVNSSIDSGPQILAEIIAITEPCSGLANGSFAVTSTGGTGDLSVLVNNNTSPANDFFGDLSAGVYVIFVEDNLGCEFILEYELLDLIDPITVNSIDIVSPDCNTGPNGGQVSFNVSSTNPLATYELGAQSNTTPDFTGLTAGDYDYQITDTQGCNTQGSLSIAAATEFQVNTTIFNVSCYGEDDGGFEFEVTNIQGDFTSLLDNEAVTTSMITGLSAGDYVLTIEDEEGCVVELAVPVGSPNEIMVNVELTPGDCNDPDSSVSLDGTGGTGTLTYEVDGTTNMTGFFSDLEGGETYEIITTDESGCQSMMDFTTPVFQMFEIEVLSTGTIGCAGDSTGVIELTITGGTPPFEFYLDGELTNGPIFENLVAGGYMIEVFDAEGCMNTVNPTIVQPISFSVEIETSTGGCEATVGNGLIVSPEGGEPPFTLYVNNEVQTSFNLTDLPNGDYEVEVIDNTGCSGGIETISLQGSEPIEIVINNQSDVSCFGRSDGSLDYSFDTNVGITGITLIPDDTNFNALSAGSYTIQVTNTDGCTAELVIDITEPGELIIADEELVPAGNLAGSASFTLAGGTAPFTFEVNGVENEDGIFSLLQGDYSLKVTDSHGCMLFHDFIIDMESSIFEANALSLEVHPNPVSDLLYLDCKECGIEAEYRLLGIDGKTLRNWQKFEAQISLENIPTGVVLLELKEGLKSSTLRIIKN